MEGSAEREATSKLRLIGAIPLFQPPHLHRAVVAVRGRAAAVALEIGGRDPELGLPGDELGRQPSPQTPHICK